LSIKLIAKLYILLRFHLLFSYVLECEWLLFLLLVVGRYMCQPLCLSKVEQFLIAEIMVVELLWKFLIWFFRICTYPNSLYNSWTPQGNYEMQSMHSVQMVGRGHVFNSGWRFGETLGFIIFAFCIFINVILQAKLVEWMIKQIGTIWVRNINICVVGGCLFSFSLSSSTSAAVQRIY